MKAIAPKRLIQALLKCVAGLTCLVELASGMKCSAASEKGESVKISSDSPGRDAISNAVETIKSCPAWTRLSANDKDAKQSLLECLDKLSREKTSVLSNAIQRFIAQRRAEGAYSVDDMSRLFLLDRYIFSVPTQSKLSEARFFGGWIGVPHDDNLVDLLWPFKIGRSGRLELAGVFGGYNGDDFEALQEFDYFNQKFGRRNPK